MPTKLTQGVSAKGRGVASSPPAPTFEYQKALNHQRVYLPSPELIKIEAEKIRGTWTEEQRMERETLPTQSWTVQTVDDSKVHGGD